MRKRRGINVFGLSFLDVMFCGFGSVILLVMIINSKTITHRTEVHDDLRGEVTRLEREVLEGETYLATIRDSLEETERARLATRRESEDLAEAIARMRRELEALEQASASHSSQVERLKSELKKLDADSRRLGKEVAENEERGRKVREFVGEGDRQYLTGLKLGGGRILVLVDSSASMLDETIVNIIRRRNLPPERRIQSPKWRRVLATVEWLVANIPRDSRYQIYTFDTQARPVLGSSPPGWLDADDGKTMDAVVEKLFQVVPEGGTSLYNAFAAAAALEPRPDNIVLLTDGLPTQGASAPILAKVSGKQRLRHFERAVAKLPRGIPVNTILFPIEGDPLAASAFWQLAGYSHGSFLTPSRDWP